MRIQVAAIVCPIVLRLLAYRAYAWLQLITIFVQVCECVCVRCLYLSGFFSISIVWMAPEVH